MHLNFNDKFDEFIDEYEANIEYNTFGDLTYPERSYEKQIRIRVRVDDDVVGFMHVNAYDIKDIDEAGEDVFAIMDDEDGDQSIAGYVIKEHIDDKYDEILEEIWEAGVADARLHAIYVSTVFVDPQYRGCGIGRFLWENYEKVLYHNGILPIMSAVVVRPQIWEGESFKDNLDSPEMAKHMTDVIIKNGFIETKEEKDSVFYKFTDAFSLVDNDEYGEDEY